MTKSLSSVLEVDNRTPAEAASYKHTVCMCSVTPLKQWSWGLISSEEYEKNRSYICAHEVQPCHSCKSNYHLEWAKWSRAGGGDKCVKVELGSSYSLRYAVALASNYRSLTGEQWEISSGERFNTPMSNSPSLSGRSTTLQSPRDANDEMP